jgi:hypothetical protein
VIIISRTTIRALRPSRSPPLAFAEIEIRRFAASASPKLSHSPRFDRRDVTRARARPHRRSRERSERRAAGDRSIERRDAATRRRATRRRNEIAPRELLNRDYASTDRR